MFRRMLMLVPIAALAIGGSTACATKKFVRTNVGQVNDKVDSLGRSLEETQERTRQNESKITDVDQRAQAAAQAANQTAQGAQSAADKANTAAGQAVLVAAGGSVTTLEGAPLTYGKGERGYANPAFVARGLT